MCRYSRHINHEDTALTLQKMLRKLIERGWTQEAIAEELKARGAGGKLRQTTISRVLREDSCRWSWARLSSGCTTMCARGIARREMVQASNSRT
jgi:hypothetical protein